MFQSLVGQVHPGVASQQGAEARPGLTTGFLCISVMDALQVPSLVSAPSLWWGLGREP